MIRRLFTTASVLSLLLCAASVAFWVRGHTRTDYVEWVSRDRRAVLFVGSMGRCLRISTSRATYPVVDWDELGLRWVSHEYDELDASGNYPIDRGATRVHGGAFLGLWWWTIGTVANGAGQLNVPLLWLGLVFSFAPAIRLIQRHRPAPGHCSRCGYDLRASKERCPECGTSIKPEAKA